MLLIDLNKEYNISNEKSDEYKMSILENINLLYKRLNRFEDYIITKKKILEKVREKGIYLLICLFIYLIV